MSSLPQYPDITTLLDEIANHGKDAAHQKIGAREALVAKARLLIASLETPIEAITWMAWAEPTRNTAARVAVDLGLFEKLAVDEGRAKSSSELAAMAGADPRLVGRIMRHLAAMHMIAEVDADTYKPTVLSLALTVPKFRDGIPFCFDCAGPSFLKLPSYLATTGYMNPEDSTNGPFQYGHDTKLSCREWRAEHPEVRRAFNNHMAGYAQGRPKWMDADFYPVAERLGHGLKTGDSNTLIVDVGGGLGHDLVEFKTKHPGIPGRLILQDLPETIKQIDQIKDGIEPTIHDFLTPQPIKGARAYYMHSVLHDWTDERCRTILQNLIPAMDKGYSKILINENVVPDIGASWKITSLDWFMMALAASSERTEAQWRDLLSSVGLKITEIWTKAPGVESLIEAVLEDDDTASRAND